MIRVIATFTEDTKYAVVVDDEGDNFVILDPDHGVTCTQIVGSYPCVRRAVFQDMFKQSQVGYALILGNIMHNVFEQKIQNCELDDEMCVRQAMRENLTQMYCAGVEEYQVFRDAKRSIENMESWMEQIADFKSNTYGIKFDRAIASEQEYNSPVFGLRGKIDATIKLTHPTTGESRVTALELKTGREQPSHRG